MSIAVVLNVVGIAFNAIGVYLIFCYGISPLIGQKGSVATYTNKELAERNSEANKKNKKYWLLSRIGLLLCIIAAVLQIVPYLLSAIF